MLPGAHTITLAIFHFSWAMNKRRKESLRNRQHTQKHFFVNTPMECFVCVRSFLFYCGGSHDSFFTNFQTKLFLGRVNLFSIFSMLFFWKIADKNRGGWSGVKGFIEFLMSHDWLRLRRAKKFKNKCRWQSFLPMKINVYIFFFFASPNYFFSVRSRPFGALDVLNACERFIWIPMRKLFFSL